MFAKMWRWADRQQVEAASGFADPKTKLWLLKRMVPPKPVMYIGILPLCKEHCGMDTITDPDGDGIVWVTNGPDGPEEWIDPLPTRVLKPEAYRYVGRVTFFNDDGTCPDHTTRSGPFVTVPINVKYPAAGEPRLDDKMLAARVSLAIKRAADEVRAIVAVQERQFAEAVGGYRRDYGDVVGEKFAGLAIRCGDCVKPAEKEN
jgi:hypothetical protein